MSNKNILVTGGTGQVGRELRDILPTATYVSSADYNLTSQREIDSMYANINPDIVIHLAAKVGGIVDNINNPTGYYTDNVLMNTLLVGGALKYNVENFIGILSTCIYPDIGCNYPITEDTLHDGPPAKSNFTYGIAKRAMAVHIDAINEQYDKKYCYITPCNLYGQYDKFDERGHFVAHLLQKIHAAKSNNERYITLYGDGTPLRQFIHAKDLATIIKLMIQNNIYKSFNVAGSENLSIAEIARIALNVTGCSNIKIKYDASLPNGQHRKDVDTGTFSSLFPHFKFTDLATGLRETYNTVFA